MKSRILRLYSKVAPWTAWLAAATPEEAALVDSIYCECEEHYAHGGDVVVECYTPGEVLANFESLADVREFCGLKAEAAANCRFGDGSPEDEAVRERSANFDELWPG